jgi:hypothetical protein
MNDQTMKFNYPRWIHDLCPSEKIQREEKLKFLIKLAALYATPDGTIGALCKLLGKNKQAFAPQFRGFNNQPLNINLAIEIEKVVGADNISRKDLCPHIFE